jgi:hypothetical protein
MMGHINDTCGVPSMTSFLRTVLLPLVIVALFALALFAVSARIWLPGDMAAPAPIG